MQAQWDTGYLIGLYITISLAAIAWLVTIAAGITWLRSRERDESISGPMFLIGLATALIVGIIGTVLAFPFSGQYHRFAPKAGIVTRVGSRFLASDTQGGGTTQKYVVTFSDGQSYGCLDTRCANVETGDRLTLLCERSFQFNAPAEGWDCNWGIDRKPNGEIIP